MFRSYFEKFHARVVVCSRVSLFTFTLAASAVLVGPNPVSAEHSRYFLTSGQASAPPSGAANLCKTYPWACSRNNAGRAIDKTMLQTIAAVNKRVNREVRYVTDQRQFRTSEHWTLPTNHGGDCEDFALLKKQRLMQMGFDPKSLLIATVLDRNRNGHAVLVVRTKNGDLVLDNATHRILPWAKTGYVFLRMQDPHAPQRWVSVVTS